MQFQKFLERNGLTIPQVAADWGIHPSTLWRVASGKMFASPDIMLRAMKLSNGQVGPIDWLQTFAPSLSEAHRAIIQEFPNGQKARPKRPYIRRKPREEGVANAAA